MKLTFEQYLREKGVSPSTFKGSWAKTPYHIKYYIDNPDTTETKSTTIGDIAHISILEKERLNTYILISGDNFKPGFKSNKNGMPNMVNAENKAIIQNIKKDNPGKEIIMPEITDIVGKMIESYSQLKNIENIINLETGVTEDSLIFYGQFDPDTYLFIGFIKMTDDEYKLLPEEEKIKYIRLKTRPDYYNLQMNYALDLKCTRNIDPIGFGKDIITYGYLEQAAFVSDAIYCIHGQFPDSFYFIAIEDVEPYSAVRYNVLYEDLDFGRYEYIKKLQWIYKGYRTGFWPGYDMYSDVYDSLGNQTGALNVKIPTWAKNKS